MKTRMYSNDKRDKRKTPIKLFLKQRVITSKNQPELIQKVPNDDMLADLDSSDYYCKNNYTDINSFQILMKLFYNNNNNQLMNNSQSEMELGTVQIPQKTNFTNFMKNGYVLKDTPNRIYCKKKIPVPFQKTFCHQKKNIRLFGHYFLNKNNYYTSIENNSNEYNKNDDSNDINEFNKGEQNFILRGQIPSYLDFLNFPETYGDRMGPMETLNQKYINPINDSNVLGYNKIKNRKNYFGGSKKKYIFENDVAKSDNNIKNKNLGLNKPCITLEYTNKLKNKKSTGNIKIKNYNNNELKKHARVCEKISHSEEKKLNMSSSNNNENDYNDNSLNNDITQLIKDEMNETTSINTIQQISINKQQDKFLEGNRKKKNDIAVLLKNIKDGYPQPKKYLVCSKKNIEICTPLKMSFTKKTLEVTNEQNISDLSDKNKSNTINIHYKCNKLNCVKKDIKKDFIEKKLLRNVPSNKDIVKNKISMKNIQTNSDFSNSDYVINNANKNLRNRSCKNINYLNDDNSGMIVTKKKFNKSIKTLNRKILNKGITNNIISNSNNNKKTSNVAYISNKNDNNSNTNSLQNINETSILNKTKNLKKRSINYRTIVKDRNKSNNLKKSNNNNHVKNIIIASRNNVNNTNISNFINPIHNIKNNDLKFNNIKNINCIKNKINNINIEQKQPKNNNRNNIILARNINLNNFNISKDNFGSKQITGESSTIINYTNSDIFGLAYDNFEDSEHKTIRKYSDFDDFDRFDDIEFENSENISQSDTILEGKEDKNNYFSYQLNKNFTNAKKTINDKKQRQNSNTITLNVDDLNDLKKSIFSDDDNTEVRKNSNSSFYQIKMYNIFTICNIEKFLDKKSLVILSSLNKYFYKNKRINVFKHFYYLIIKDYKNRENLLKIFKNNFRCCSSLELRLAYNKNQLKTKFEYYFKKIKSIYNETIQKDISRTFPSDKNFDRIHKNKLFRILISYSNFNKNIGYAQGLNFVAASSMYLFDKEEEAFIFLDSFVNRLKLYNNLGIENKKLLNKMKYFSFLLNKYIPEFANYLRSKYLNHEFFSAGWIITVFSNTMDKKNLFICWSFMVIFGWKFFYAFIIQVLMTYKNNIINSDERILSGKMKTILNSQQFSNDFNYIIKNTLIFMLEHIIL